MIRSVGLCLQRIHKISLRYACGQFPAIGGKFVLVFDEAILRTTFAKFEKLSIIHNRSLNSMATQIHNILPKLISSAQESTMGNRHAAALYCGKKIYTISSNYSLLGNEQVSFINSLGRTPRPGSQRRCEKASQP